MDIYRELNMLHHIVTISVCYGKIQKSSDLGKIWYYYRHDTDRVKNWALIISCYVLTLFLIHTTSTCIVRLGDICNALRYSNQYFIFGILIGHDLSMRILYRFHGWLIFARVLALFIFVWPYVRLHILCTQLVICLLSHFINIWYLDWPWSEHIIPISLMVDFARVIALFMFPYKLLL